MGTDASANARRTVAFGATNTRARGSSSHHAYCSSTAGTIGRDDASDHNRFRPAPAAKTEWPSAARSSAGRNAYASVPL